MPLPGTYANNSSTFAPVAQVGFKISKPGFNAKTTAGQNLVFDSSWPSLPIAFETTIPNPIHSSSDTATIPHNLQFSPLTFIWAYYPDPSGIGNVGYKLIGKVDNQNIYLNGNLTNSPPFNATMLKIRCFQLDLSIDIDYSLAPGDTFNFPYDNSYGVKVVKANKSIDSKDMRDFAVHSRCQSPLILAVKTEKTIVPANIGTGIGNVVQFTNKLAYPVWVYGFTKSATGYFPAPYYTQSYPRTFTDGFTSYIGYEPPFGDIGATLVVLRDPMFAANSLTVQY
jgi:hypothetical protein